METSYLNCFGRHNSINTCAFGVAPPHVTAQLEELNNTSLGHFSPDDYYCLIDRFWPVQYVARKYAIPRVRGTTHGSAPFTPTITHPFEYSGWSPNLQACMALLRVSEFDPGALLYVAKPLSLALQDGIPPLDRDELLKVRNGLLLSVEILLISFLIEPYSYPKAELHRITRRFARPLDRGRQNTNHPWQNKVCAFLFAMKHLLTT